MSLKKPQEIKGEEFERLLGWLDTDRDRAGDKYEQIRCRLIQIFEARSCPFAEDLADKTLDRVAGKVESIIGTYVGRPELYFYGVAQKIYLEYLRKEPAASPPVACGPSEREYDCLDSCLKHLTPRNRRMILQYYQEKEHTRTETRKELARRLGIGPNALRIRAHRIRESLAACLANCLKEKQ